MAGTKSRSCSFRYMMDGRTQNCPWICITRDIKHSSTFWERLVSGYQDGYDTLGVMISTGCKERIACDKSAGNTCTWTLVGVFAGFVLVFFLMIQYPLKEQQAANLKEGKLLWETQHVDYIGPSWRLEIHSHRLALGQELIVDDNVTVILKPKIKLTSAICNTGWETANYFINKIKWVLQTCNTTNHNLRAPKNYTQIVNNENNTIIFSNFSINAAKKQ